MRVRAGMSLLLLSIFLFAGAAFSKDFDLSGVLQKKQSVISGVLNPGSVSFNGQEIYNGKDNFSALLINKVPVKITEVSGLKTFYMTTDESSLELEWQAADGSTRSILKVQYPALTEFKTDANQLYVKFNEHVSAASLDSKAIDIKSNTVEIDNFKTWVNETHTLELFSGKNTGQIYNLDFKNMKSEMLTNFSLSFSVGDAPFSANIKPTAFGLNFRLLNENNISTDIGVYLAEVKYEAGNTGSGNNIRQNTGQLKGRYGYNPFDADFGGFSYKRLTFGVQSEAVYYKRESEFINNFDGLNGDKVDIWFLQGGPFFRFEPYQFKTQPADFGIFINFDFRIFRTYQDLSGDGDIKSLGLSYYY